MLARDCLRSHLSFSPCCWPEMAGLAFPRSLLAQVQGIIDQCNGGSLPLNTGYEDICDILFSQKILVERQLLPMEVFVHPSNRGKTSVNAYNVHRNGANIMLVGTDPKELHKSAAFQIAPMDPQRSHQLLFNRKLVEEANQMLAEPGGRNLCCLWAGVTWQRSAVLVSRNAKLFLGLLSQMIAETSYWENWRRTSGWRRCCMRDGPDGCFRGSARPHGLPCQICVKEPFTQPTPPIVIPMSSRSCWSSRSCSLSARQGNLSRTS